ncbi:type II secretion system protein N [Metapseudomonas otitidis]|uniref:type II secretion system protein N n=1 Tax=Metapseudomonas otitidis TaxID=319939 RepID=UPI0013F5BA82|nr:type II secretion system protein N [Pseudomonas otitidis]
MAIILHTLNQLAATRAVKLSSLSLCSFLMLAALTWHGLQLRAVLHPPVLTPSAMSKPDPQDRPTPLGKGLLVLFGSSAEAESVTAEALEKLPESNLDLQVSAIFFMAPAEQSTVILEDGDRTLILKPGEEVRPGIAVQRIESHRITLKRNGKLEQVSFRGFGEISGSSPTPESTMPVTQSINPASDTLTSSLPTAAEPTVASQSEPTAYQQFIQRKLAQNK